MYALTEPTAGAHGREGAHKVHTLDVVALVEVVVVRDDDLQTVRVLQMGWSVTTLLRVVLVPCVCTINKQLILYSQRGAVVNTFK